MDAVRTLSLVAIADGRHGVGSLFQAENGVGRSRGIVAPWIDAAIRPARRLLPLSFCGQPLAYPQAVAHGIHPVDPTHGLVRTDDRCLLISEPPRRFALDCFDKFGEPSVCNFKFIDKE